MSITQKLVKSIMEYIVGYYTVLKWTSSALSTDYKKSPRYIAF